MQLNYLTVTCGQQSNLEISNKKMKKYFFLHYLFPNSLVTPAVVQ